MEGVQRTRHCSNHPCWLVSVTPLDWLDMDLILPFKIGNFAEAKSFVAGFKGAWFRCKVNDMRVTESGHLEYYLEYIDYTEEAEEWTEVFQKNPLKPASRKKKSSASSQVMLRPPFPQWYRGDQVPEQFSKSDVIAIVCATWKVGDLVEWLCQDCYWTAKITRLLSEDEVEHRVSWNWPVDTKFACYIYRYNGVVGWLCTINFLDEEGRTTLKHLVPRNDNIASYEIPSSGQQLKYEVNQMVKVGLLEPPLGEGGCHHANCKDLRPALDWSMVKGWTVPLSKANGKFWYAARLIHPKYDIEEGNTDEEMTFDDNKQEEQKSLKRASDISKDDHESSNVTPSSDTNKSPGTVENTIAEQNGLSNGNRVRRYPLRSRKFVKYASGKQK